jgi:hypothetical protein
MTEFNGAMSEEEKIMAIMIIALNLIKQNEHLNSYAEATKNRA